MPGNVNLSKSDRHLRVSDEDLHLFSQYVRTWNRVSPINSVIEIEGLVADLLEALTDAIKAVGKLASEPRGRSAPWWDEECKIKYCQYKYIPRSTEEAIKCQKEFRATVKKTKKEYWRKQVKS